MPVFMRNFYLRELVDIKKKEKEATDKAQKNIKTNSPRFKK